MLDAIKLGYTNFTALIDMKLIRFEVKIRYASDTRPHTPAQIVAESIIGPHITKGQTPQESVSFKDEKAKCVVRWDYKLCSVVYEDIDNHESCISKTIKAFENINKSVPIRKWANIEALLFWLLPTPSYEFKALEQKYRGWFTNNNPLFVNVVDSSLIIDSEVGNNMLHHQSGAMSVNQLQRRFRVFPVEDKHPKVFLFLMTQIQNNHLTPYSRSTLEKFLTEAYNIASEHSTKFENAMEVVL